MRYPDSGDNQGRRNSSPCPSYSFISLRPIAPLMVYYSILPIRSNPQSGDLYPKRNWRATIVDTDRGNGIALMWDRYDCEEPYRTYGARDSEREQVAAAISDSRTINTDGTFEIPCI